MRSAITGVRTVDGFGRCR